MYKTCLFVLLMSAYCSADKTPYDTVGKCRDEFRNFAIKRSFNIDEISDQGDFTYFYSTAYISGTCATAKIEIQTDKSGSKRYFGSATVFQKDLTSTTFSYENFPTDVNGYIREVQTIGEATYTFTLIIRDYDSDKGVLSYIRCSDEGLGSTNLRSIAVKINNAQDPEALKLVDDYLTEDKNEFSTDLVKVNPCTK